MHKEINTLFFFKDLYLLKNSFFYDLFFFLNIFLSKMFTALGKNLKVRSFIFIKTDFFMFLIFYFSVHYLKILLH
jgi:hypothetical protein